MPRISTQIYFKKSLPTLEDLGRSSKESDYLYIVDQKLLAVNPQVARWLNKKSFVYSVSAGESLKSITHLPLHLQNIFKLLGPAGHRGLTLVALGGGSVGDFAGFVASIFKRGIDLVHIPSTWLAAIDSSHGGKNGLNIGSLKNQIGTFHLPTKIFIVDSVLRSQDFEVKKEALGELYKMALLTKESWGRELLRHTPRSATQFSSFVEKAITAKYQVVASDLYEKKGRRVILNLGHTFGHVLELSQNIPHGRAVTVGLDFAIKVSRSLGLLKAPCWKELECSGLYKLLQDISYKPVSAKITMKILAQDKKKWTAETIHFIGLRDFGVPVVQVISIEQLIEIGIQQGFIQP